MRRRGKARSFRGDGNVLVADGVAVVANLCNERVLEICVEGFTLVELKERIDVDTCLLGGVVFHGGRRCEAAAMVIRRLKTADWTRRRRNEVIAAAYGGVAINRKVTTYNFLSKLRLLAFPSARRDLTRFTGGIRINTGVVSNTNGRLTRVAHGRARGRVRCSREMG